MKRLGILASCAVVLAFVTGCDGGGVEVGTPSDTSKGAQTSEFKAAMEKAGSKMMKGQRPKNAGGTAK